MLANGTFQIVFPTLAGRSYEVQYSTNLTTGWTPAAQPLITGNGSWHVWIDNGQPTTPGLPRNSQMRFYRVTLLP